MKTSLRILLAFMVVYLGQLPRVSSGDPQPGFPKSLQKQPPSPERLLNGKGRHLGPSSRPPRQGPGSLQIDMLRRLLDAPPEQLRYMRETIERIERMSPEQREDMRRRLHNFRDLPQHRRSEVFSDFHRRQDQLHRYWESLPPEKREREKRRLHNLPAHERKAFLDRTLGEFDRGRKPPSPSSPPGPPHRKSQRGRPSAPPSR